MIYEPAHIEFDKAIDVCRQARFRNRPRSRTDRGHAVTPQAMNTSSSSIAGVT
jgi:DNA/RNA endonuclease G (NUC1)